VTAEVISRDKNLKRNGDRLVEAAGFGRAEHDDRLLAADGDDDGE
jgi:hypothetical protein